MNDELLADLARACNLWAHQGSVIPSLEAHNDAVLVFARMVWSTALHRIQSAQPELSVSEVPIERTDR